MQDSGDLATAKKVYGYALSATVKYRYKRDQEMHEHAVPQLHTNLANMLCMKSNQYDDAFHHYKEAIKKSKKFNELTFWNTMRLFLSEDWRTNGWRFKTAVLFMGQHLRDKNRRIEFEQYDFQYSGRTCSKGLDINM